MRGPAIISDMQCHGMILVDLRLNESPGVMKRRAKRYADEGADFITVNLSAAKHLGAIMDAISGTDCQVIGVVPRNKALIPIVLETSLGANINGILCSSSQFDCVKDVLEVSSIFDDKSLNSLNIFMDNVVLEGIKCEDLPNDPISPEDAIKKGADYVVIEAQLLCPVKNGEGYVVGTMGSVAKQILRDINHSVYVGEFYKRGLIGDGHFKYASGRHGNKYIRKDILDDMLYVFKTYVDTGLIDYVIGPPHSGSHLASLFWLQLNLSGRTPVKFMYPNKVLEAKKTGGRTTITFKPNFAKKVKGKHFLIVDDVYTTGGTIDKLEAAICLLGGHVQGNLVIFDRSYMNTKRVASVICHRFPDWRPGRKYCPMCKKGIPLSTNVGHGGDKNERV
jgi:orotate phosphoribosyltransferase